jgi:hypothetical protein
MVILRARITLKAPFWSKLMVSEFLASSQVVGWIWITSFT